MSSQPNDSTPNALLEGYLSRVEAQLSDMPEQTRAEEREELTQHLAEMAAAKSEGGLPDESAWAKALKEFGEPEQVGRELFQEWQKTSNGRMRSQVRVILATAFVQTALMTILAGLYSLARGLANNPHPRPPIWIFLLASLSWRAAQVLIPLYSGWRIGSRMKSNSLPEQAIPPALYTGLVYSLFAWLPNYVEMTVFVRALDSFQHIHAAPYPLTVALIYFPPISWIALQCVSAYFACARKRHGVGRLATTDWKLKTQ